MTIPEQVHDTEKRIESLEISVAQIIKRLAGLEDLVIGKLEILTEVVTKLAGGGGNITLPDRKATHGD